MLKKKKDYFWQNKSISYRLLSPSKKETGHVYWQDDGAEMQDQSS